MAGLMAAVCQPWRYLRLGLNITSQTVGNNLIKVENSMLTSIRTKVRCYFPRANEVKRVRRHGWEHRISSPNGRKIIMRRLLKGRHVLTH